MKAAFFDQYGPPEVIQTKDIDLPTIKGNEILLKVRSAAVTMGDCEMRSPKIPNFTWFIVRLVFGYRKPRKKVLGSYVSGVIEAVGEAIKSFKVGDSVFGVSEGFGAHAEYLKLSDKAAMVLLPESATHEEAAPIGLGLDSLHFLRKAEVKEGEHVLINGAGGGIGTYAVQLARYFGAEVTAVDSADKLDMLKEVGAAHVIDYQKEDFTKNGQTYDVIFDVVGMIPRIGALRLLKDKGRYISAIPLVSNLIPNWWVGLTSDKKMMTGLTSATVEDLNFLKERMKEGCLKTPIDRKYALEDMVDAHGYIESGAKKGNIVIAFDE